MQKILIIMGVLLVLIGLIWPWLKKSGLGRLPGDIVLRKGGAVFYFPIVTCIIISVVVSLILWFFNR